MPYGPLFRRTIEREKNLALATNGGDAEAHMSMSNNAKSDLRWWISNLPHSSAPMNRNHPDYVLETDASALGWGANLNGRTTGGRWSKDESNRHINWLELKACFLALKSFFHKAYDIHILVRSDNVSVVAYIGHFGGSKSVSLNALTREIWLFCMARSIWLTASHIPGSRNIEADSASRQFQDNLEWKLNPSLFSEILNLFPIPDIDLFASRLNYQIMPYVSWKKRCFYPGLVQVFMLLCISAILLA